jgi:hypothetical protein
LASYTATVTKTVDFGLTPRGHRRDVHFSGRLVGDDLSGTMEGIDYITVDADGRSLLNVWATITTEDGALISAHIEGFSEPETGVLRDTQIRLTTSHERYVWLCHKIIVGRGRADRTEEGTTLHFDYYIDDL